MTEDWEPVHILEDVSEGVDDGCEEIDACWEVGLTVCDAVLVAICDCVSWELGVAGCEVLSSETVVASWEVVAGGWGVVVASWEVVAGGWEVATADWEVGNGVCDSDTVATMTVVMVTIGVNDSVLMAGWEVLGAGWVVTADVAGSEVVVASREVVAGDWETESGMVVFGDVSALDSTVLVSSSTDAEGVCVGEGATV